MATGPAAMVWVVRSAPFRLPACASRSAPRLRHAGGRGHQPDLRTEISLDGLPRRAMWLPAPHSVRLPYSNAEATARRTPCHQG
jgi:hypothetical protein